MLITIIILFIVSIACVIAIGGLIQCLNEKHEEIDRFKADAISRGYAGYNPKTGEWQWKS